MAGCLHERAMSGDISARNEIVLANLHLAKGFAYTKGRKMSRGQPIEDILAYANVGLIEAASVHDPSKGNFESTAFVRMRHAVRQGVVQMTRWMSNVPGSDGGRAPSRPPEPLGEEDELDLGEVSPCEAVAKLPWGSLKPLERDLVEAGHISGCRDRSFKAARKRLNIKENAAIRSRNNGIRKLRHAAEDMLFFVDS
jgi:hypothetical protein